MTARTHDASRVRLSFVALVSVAFVLPVLSSGAFVGAMEAEARHYVVGLHDASLLNEGDLYNNGVVYHVDHTLRFISVETTDPLFKASASADPNVRYVEEEAVFHADFTPNDPQYGSQYGPDQINAPAAWDLARGTLDAKVCILDSGVRYTHEDLGEARWLGGKNYVTSARAPWDDRGHGTAMAGIAAAGLDNAVGIAGMGNVGIYDVKVLDNLGDGVAGDFASGIRWCADNAGPNTVISMSFSGRVPSQAVAEAVDYAHEKGLLLVASTGNGECGSCGGCDDCVGYPAKFEKVIAVGCTDGLSLPCLKFQSNGVEMELVAPGTDILTTCFEHDASYCARSGTSASVPFVSGLAALYWSYNPTISNVELRRCLQDSARDLGIPGRDSQTGYGEVDAEKLFRTCGAGGSPANDDLSAARPASGIPYSYSQNTYGATTTADEPQPCGTIGSTVWFTWTPAKGGQSIVDTFGSNFNTALAVYADGGAAGLQLVGCNEQPGGSRGVQVTFDAQGGTTYHFQAGGVGGETGNLWFSLRCPVCVPPPNDNFDAAEEMVTLPFSQAQPTQGGTVQSGESRPCGSIGATTWFKWTAPASTRVSADTFNSNFDTVLAAYQGASLATLQLVACNDDARQTRQSLVEFDAQEGTTYYLQAGGFGGGTGRLQFNVQCSPACSARPPHDDFADGATIWAPQFSQVTQTKAASSQPQEWSACGAIANTVWYRITPTQDALVTLSTAGSDYDTVLALYTGASFHGLQPVLCNDDVDGTLQSEVWFHLLAGTTYHIQAGGYKGATGTLQFNLQCNTQCFVASGVPNDEPSSAYAIGGIPYASTQLTGPATLGPGESALCGDIGATVWYKYQPSNVLQGGVLRADTSGSDFDTVLAVYADVRGTLVPLGCNDDVPGQGLHSQVTFVALPATVTYYLQVGGHMGKTGTLQLNLGLAPVI